MTLSEIQLHGFRCFPEKKLSFDSKFNFISGANGAGKTAVLEAIALLSLGRSFRTHEIAPLIHYEKEEMTVFGTLHNGHSLSIKKSRKATTQIKINAQPCLRTSELARFLPSQIIYQDLFDIIDAGPTARRQLLDWGVFHVKPSYLELLKAYKQALKQRNLLLKQRVKPSVLTHWNKTMSHFAHQIDEHRGEYFEHFKKALKPIVQQLMAFDCELDYFDGWRREAHAESLFEKLERSYEQDIQRQSTRFGPHHADFEIKTQERKAKLYLSRGQQKMLLIALKLAQAAIIDKPCIYLWDDIGTELDKAHGEKLSELMASMQGQFFISGVARFSHTYFQGLSGTQINL